ncbi:3-hydroxyacyl-CoA dehydrogenase NAD-binding domain-containing protein [Glaciimonas immobilis]|uniref:3-hydroxyacyl-CoA dehydrogenase n=1 Tax=Glaciimonas immobilis TaxID=728004 RepID=A0A840RVH2_9BURK|nr:3-hydroxyacyl-CoA dehydrogenase NAD-binding domain-containing protein [Glaciimonas immobilis]KAF3999986.1 3-hydroxyacyl-CoA dehydrogenase [Glaciimonas immobilis]MBB5200490.1 3-hydroxyacyl-CoA dehydrogenase [Glaciimonas immobilis]
MTAEYQRHGTVALITLNNPPVNGMGLVTRTALVDGINKALNDDAVTAIVIIGAGKAFSGGADIKEFNSPKALAEPSLHTVILTVESASKPVIAAIHTICMGGGLELSLACHYRVATPTAQIALPEVKLGLLPGAGGTQRLPRAVGLELAVKMIVTGNPIAAEKLSATALFDAIIHHTTEDEWLKHVLAFANKVTALRPLPKIRNMKVDYPDYKAFLQSARLSVKASSEHFPAPLKCIDAIEAAITKEFEEGLQYERDLFMALLETTTSKAMRHAFFGERAASKIAGLSAATPQRHIASVAVIGAGTMGGGIAMNFANAGIAVTIVETSTAALEKGLSIIRKNYENTLKKGKLTQDQCDQRIALISGALEFAAISQADLVIEAVFEELAVKKAVFKSLDAVMKPGAILASNTSTLNLDEIAAAINRPRDVIGMHFFSPANVMQLLEVVRGKKTADDVLATIMALAKKIRKTAVVAGVCDGFIGNRMIEQLIRQAGFLLDEGCLPQQVDKAMEQFGWAMGPFRMSDLAGNDIGWTIRKRRAIKAPDMTYSKTADLLCEMGRFGQKTGAGWYDYKTGDRTAYPAAVVDNLIVKHSANIGIVRRPVDDLEIVERLVFALINEAAQILDEGIAQKASDVDIVYLTGYGFPLFRGGPLFYADTTGLSNVAAAIEKYARGLHGEAWKVAPLLLRLAAQNKTFN